MAETQSREGNISGQTFTETLLEYVSDGIYITDNEANTIYVNHRYELVSGLRRSEMLGRNMADLVKEGVVSQSGTLSVLHDEKPVTLEQSFRTGKHAVITSSPIYSESGDDKHLLMVLTVVREVTEIYSLRNELERIRDQNQILNNEVQRLRDIINHDEKIVAEDQSSKDMIQILEKMALLDDTLLISGEAGTGKEFYARFIHQNSRRNICPFMKIDFSVIPEGSAAPYIFGSEDPVTHEFHRGIMESVEGGTVYIEDIMEMPPEVQGRFLLLFQRKACVMGDGKIRHPDVRFLVGSKKSFRELSENKMLERELLKTLQMMHIDIKPVRERRDDIIPLAVFFLTQYNRQSGDAVKFSKESLQNMLTYSWPENVEEIRKRVRRAAIICREEEITVRDLFPEEEVNAVPASTIERDGFDLPLKMPETGSFDMKTELARIEAAYMADAFNRCGNARQAAEMLGMDSSTFVRKRQKYSKLGFMKK